MPQVENFCGRKRETDALAALLRRRRRQGVRVVVLDGLAGSGKTTLMRQVAHQHEKSFDGFIAIDLNGSTDRPISPAELLGKLAVRLHVSTAGLDGETLYRRYRQAMAGRRLLILLDDAADARQIRQVVEFGGDSVVLVTSRVELPGLPASARISVGSFGRREALDLLAGTAVGAGRVAAEPDAAARIVRRCGYLPLAIQLVGGRLAGESRRLASLEELDADLAATGLTGIAARDADTADGSARTIREIFDGSYRRLAPELRRMFRLLGGDVRETDVETAAALADVPERRAAELLRNLHAHRLVEPVPLPPVRYRLHDLLREFAQELAAEDPAEAAGAAHRLAVLRLRQVEEVAAGQRYETALATAGAAAAQVPRALSHEDHATCWRLVAALAHVYEVIGFPVIWPNLLEHGTAAVDAIGDEQGRVALLLAEAAHRAHRRQWAELLDLLAGTADTASNAPAATLRSRAYAAVGEPGRAVAEARRALSNAPDDGTVRVRALVALSEALRADGSPAQAAARSAEAVDSAGAMPVERSRALHAHAITLAELGRVQEAVAALSEAAGIDTETGDEGHLLVVLVATAELCLRRAEDPGAALVPLRQAFGLRLGAEFVRRPTGGQTADALLTMAECFLELGQLPEADYAWQQADRLDVDGLATRRLVVRGALATAEGRLTEAAQALELALARDGDALSAEEERLRARAAVLLGNVDGALGDHAAAVDHYEYAESLAGEESGRLARARAAVAGSLWARAGIRRRVPQKRSRWWWRVPGALACFLALNLLAHDGSDIHVTPATNSAALTACALGALVSVRLRPNGAGTLLGYLSPVPTALGVILLTSAQVRDRGTTGMLVGHAVLAVVVAVTALWPRRISFAGLVALVVVAGGANVGAPELWTGPVAPFVWRGVGVATIVLGLMWLPVVALRHPAAHRWTTVPALVTAPLAGGGLALLLGSGLGRQTYMLWPGATGSDWRLALLGLSLAAACGCAGLVGPPRLSSGILAGLAWFWGIHAFFNGMAHSEVDPPNFYAHPGRYWDWLTSSSAWVWTLPLLSLLVVGLLGMVSADIDEYEPRLARLRPALPMPDGLAERLRTARRLRARLYGARGLTALALLAALSIPATRSDPHAPQDATYGVLFWIVLFLCTAVAVHPDIGVRDGLRWLGVAALLVTAGVLVCVNARQVVAHGWSRGAVAGLLTAAAALFGTGVVAPYNALRVGRVRLDRDEGVGLCMWAASISVIVATLVGASGTGDVLRMVLGGAAGAGALALYRYVTERRASENSQGPPAPPA
ncbi:NB-ARC domain-containing protein [Streptomyces sp. NPDC096205]|uniref:NB-ARC domain-containing protein n=1 Tax=Streptomyces sp. NPDC096205 TaxID=3366081 RepID=UPI0038094ADF